MKIIKTIQELQDIRKSINKTLGFVATMGALHDGHISLIKKAREENELVIVSIFINPKQFLAHEDLEKYPKKEQADIKICQLCKVDYLFMPEVSTMYQSEEEVLIKAPTISSYILEGELRPGHFDGVLQIVLKLFNLIQPTNAYFGKKDAQQLSIISQMVKNLFLKIKIHACEIVREHDGLALSSRNIYLSKEEKQEALFLSKSLHKATCLILKGERNSGIIKTQMKKTMENINIEYIAIVNKDFQDLKEIEISNTIILVACKFGKTRLIDNLFI